MKNMKQVWFLPLFIFISTFPVFSQRLVTVGVLPFEIIVAEHETSSIRVEEAEEIRRQIIAEMASWGVLIVLPENQKENAEYIVRGNIARQDNQIVLHATTYEARSGRALNASTEQALTIGALSIASFSTQIADHIPLPNFLLGRWRSTIETIDGPLTCILDFRADRSVRVEQYDTWEHMGTNSIRYQAIGGGTYTYAGYLRRPITIGRQEILADATVSINLSLEDALPNFTSIDVRGLRVLFNDERSSFELVYGGLPCGENHSGPSVFPSIEVFYTRFTKI
jgi:hypothetical protein